MGSHKTVYLMRGLPSAGKSHTARKLAGERGIVCETDEYFFTQVGHDPDRYDYQDELLDEARQWNFERFKRAIAEGITPIVVDRGNGLNDSTQIYAKYATDHGYEVEIREPESEWWQEIRVLLKYKQVTRPILLQWADILAKMSRATHRVPVSVIQRRMAKWKPNLTVEAILNYRLGSDEVVTERTKAGKGRPRKRTVEQGYYPEARVDYSSDAMEKNSPWVSDFLVDLAGTDDNTNPNDHINLVLTEGDTHGDGVE